MDIKFKELHIENFMSIGEATIALSDRGFTLIEGVNSRETDNARSNGSGKSSIFESLVWALTGNTMRGNKDVVNYNGTDGTLVKLSFDVGPDSFVVTRTKGHSKYKTNLFIEINGVDKSGKGIRDTEKLMSEYLPDLTPSLIGSVIVLGQGLPQKFSSNSPSGRKEVLEKLFKSDYMIQDLKDRVTRRRLELNDEILRVHDDRLVNLTKMSTFNDQMNSDRERLQDLQKMTDTESQVEALKVEISGLEDKFKELEITCKGYEYKRSLAREDIIQIKNKRLAILVSIDTEYLPVLNETQQQVNEASGVLKFTQMELQKAKNIKDVCPTCGQTLPDVHKPNISEFEKEVSIAQDRYDELSSKLSILKSEIENKKSIVTSDIDEEIVLKEKSCDSLLSIIEELTKEMSCTTRGIKERKEQLHNLLEIVNTRSFEMKQLVESITQLQTMIDELSNCNRVLEEKEEILQERLSVENKFNTAITRDFRGYLLNDIIVYIDSKVKEYCKDVFGNELISFSLEGNNLIISFDGKEYDALSGGERQKVDLIIQFAIRDMLCKHTSFSSNIIVMDEIFDNLDDLGCQKVLDLITTKLYDISSIFIITHHGNELNVPYDDIIKIEKNTDGITRLCN
jgi:DNA repair exonuclease SbcCD ATPase subunit